MKHELANLKEECRQGFEAMRAETAPPCPAENLVREMRLAQQNPPVKRRWVTGLAWGTPMAALACAAIFAWPQQSLAYSPEETIQAAKEQGQSKTAYTVTSSGSEVMIYEYIDQKSGWTMTAGDIQVISDGKEVRTISKTGEYMQMDVSEGKNATDEASKILSIEGGVTVTTTRVMLNGRPALNHNIQMTSPGGARTFKSITVDEETKAPLSAVEKVDGKETVRATWDYQTPAETPVPAAKKVYDLPKQREQLKAQLQQISTRSNTGLGLYGLVVDEHNRGVLLLENPKGGPPEAKGIWINGEPGVTTAGATIYELDAMHEFPGLAIIELPGSTHPIIFFIEPHGVFQGFRNAGQVWLKVKDNQVLGDLANVKLKTMDGKDEVFQNVPVMRTSSISDLLYSINEATLSTQIAKAKARNMAARKK